MGQVLDIHYKAPTVAVFAHVAAAREVEKFRIAGAKPLTILHILGNSLDRGAWPIIGSAPVELNPGSGPGGRQYEDGCVSYGGDGPILDLLGAHLGLRSWTEGSYDPNYLRKLVMS